jgi:alpha-beta hydrolase superfamily lysophospholipase
MWRRTAFERWFARNWRRLVVAALLVAGYACVIAGTGALLAEQLLRPARREVTALDAARARAVARRTASVLSGEALRAADNAVLRAWWFAPRANARGTAIVLHGQADNRAAMLGLAELLLHERYRVLAPDARAHGSSGGPLATYGALEREDLRAWAHWAQQQHPDQCVFAAGASMGAAILIQALPDVPFCGAVADSSFADLPSLAAGRIGAWLHLPHALHAVVAGPIVSTAMWYARLRHGVPLSTASPVARLARARVPVLVIHGTADREIPEADARALAAAQPRFVTLWLVDGAAHTQAWATAPREYPGRVLQFLAAHQ